MSQVVESIALKLEKLRSKMSSLEQENSMLQEKLDKKSQEFIQLNKRLTDQEEELQHLRIAKTMLGSDEYKRETKLKINNIIRDIDSCIKQLSV